MKPSGDRRGLLALFVASLVGAADPYAAMWQDVRALEARGALEAAAGALEAAAARWPEDHDVKLELAWLEVRRGRDEAAARGYDAVLALAPDDAAARLGLALALVRLGRCEKARPPLAAITGAEAAEARARCEAAALRVVPVLAASVLSFGENPTRASGYALLAGAELWAGPWLLGARGRRLVLSPPATSTRGDWTQHELYLDAGLGSRRAGASLHYAVVDDESGVLGTSHHAGASGRLSLFGDALLDVAVSVYDDLTVGRVAPSFRLPLGAGLSITPGAALTVTGADTLASARLTLALEREHLGLWVGGKLGDELRPALLESQAVVNARERITGGAFAGVSLRLGRFGLSAAWSLDRLERLTSTTIDDAQALSFGLSARF